MNTAVKARASASARTDLSPEDWPSPKIAGNARDDIGLRMVSFLPRLRRFAHSLTRDQERSEDLVQETCARALARSDQWRPDTRLDSWMYRIAQNLWIDQMRAEKVKGEIIDIAAAGDISGCDGRVVTESRLSLLELRKQIALLPADQRALLGLVCMDGLSYKEAAQALDSPEGTVMSRLARARRTLNEAVER
jgi:RNA polymerase sigma-70 factor (ECF subfamily)